MKLTMLKPRLATLDTNRLPMVKYPSKDTKRHTKDGNGRTLPLTSTAWRRLRRSVLAAEPLCRHCTDRGLTVQASEVDHMDGDASNNSLSNMQPLCKSCHSHKTARDMGHTVRMGCDTDGNPMDTTSPWRKAHPGPSGGLADAAQEITGS